MNTFLKIVLVAALLLVALHFTPVIAVGAVVGVFAAVILAALGLGLVAALLAVLVGFAVALSPIWIPVLIVVGLVNLFRGDARTPPPVAA